MKCRFYISTENLSYQLLQIVNFIMAVYVPVWLNTGTYTDISNGREDGLGRAELVVQPPPRGEFWIVLSPSNRI